MKSCVVNSLFFLKKMKESVFDVLLGTFRGVVRSSIMSGFVFVIYTVVLA